MSDFKTYWEDYKQTNPGYRLLEPKDLVLIGWIGRNKEIEEYATEFENLTIRARKLEKEMLQIRLQLAKVKGDSNGQG